MQADELVRAREALSLLKARKAQGLSAAQMLGASIVGASKSSYTHKKSVNDNSRHKPWNNHYRRTFNSSEAEENMDSSSIRNYKSRIDQANQRYNSRSEYVPQNSSFNPKPKPAPFNSMLEYAWEGRMTGAHRQELGSGFAPEAKHKPQSNLASLGMKALGMGANARSATIKPPVMPPVQYSTKAAVKTNAVTARQLPEDGGESKQSAKPAYEPINEYESSGPKSECKFCGRSFNPESLIKHTKVCQSRPDKKKRKVFDSKKARVVDEEQEMLERAESKPEGRKAAKKVAKWKLQSAQLRSAIAKPNKGDCEVDEKELYTPCPTCGRSFNETAAKRHIPFCADKARMESMRNGGKNLGVQKYLKRK